MPESALFEFQRVPGGVTLTRFRGEGVSRAAVPEIVEGLPVVRIAEEAFANVRGLREVTLPQTVQSLGRSVFYGCRDLEK
ncbi:MAG: leucine-rich repeat protein, partial [Thermoguttaceae bacterium]|nr:leucine-rich repeat protein [Thermoguttaceae bacterium]